MLPRVRVALRFGFGATSCSSRSISISSLRRFFPLGSSTGFETWASWSASVMLSVVGTLACALLFLAAPFLPFFALLPFAVFPPEGTGTSAPVVRMLSSSKLIVCDAGSSMLIIVTDAAEALLAFESRAFLPLVPLALGNGSAAKKRHSGERRRCSSLHLVSLSCQIRPRWKERSAYSGLSLGSQPSRLRLQ